MVVMRKTATAPRSGLMPALRYRDLPAAIDWLCGVLGFSKHHVVAAEDGTILLAQLTFGNDIVMLSPVRGSGGGVLSRADDLGIPECYFVVSDADAHCVKAKAAGAEIVTDICSYDLGGRVYSCRDPEGHVWNFGTYDPWRAGASEGVASSRQTRGGGRGLMSAALLAMFAVGMIGWPLSIPEQPSASGEEAPRIREVIASRLQAKDAAERASRQAGELREAESARLAAERSTQELREQLERGALHRMRELIASRLRAKEAAERAKPPAAKPRRAKAAS